MTLPPCSYPESFDRSVLAFVEALHEGRPAPSAVRTASPPCVSKPRLRIGAHGSGRHRLKPIMIARASAHERNQTSPQKASLSAYQVARFRRDGFLPVRQVFSPHEIAEIRDTFMDMAGTAGRGLSEGKGDLNRGGSSQYAPATRCRSIRA